MNVQPGASDSEEADLEPKAPTPAVDQRTLDRIFGQVLPESTKDDLDSSSGGGGGADEWYRSNRPPHHGG